jgi:hypothetical protein
VKGSWCDCLSKQGSGVKCEQIERYVDKWDIEVRSESGLSKLEMLIGEMKLGGNLLICDFWEVDDV